MVLRIYWMLFALTAFTSVTAYTNEVEEDDTSIEDNGNSRQPYYRESGDSLHSKPTLSEDAIFLPHEKYCQYFYAFDGKDSYIYRCASGYRFDAEKLQCVTKKNVDCGKRKKNIASSEEKDVRINFKCPKWSGVFPHTHYCQLFFYCQNKKPSLFMCPPGKAFDKDRNGCFLKKNVNCGKRDYPYDEGDSGDIGEPDAESDVTYQCLYPAGVFPDKEYCNKFIRCWYGVGEVYVCPKGKLYDVDLMKCKPKNSVYCHDRINPYAQKDDEKPILVDDYPAFWCFFYNGRYPHDVNCNQFYECVGGYGKLYACPSGKLYDTESGTCKDASQVTCGKGDDNGNDDEFECPAREGIFKDEDNCGSYYRCKKGIAYHLQCPDGELFDADWKSCADEEGVTCGDRLLPGDEEEDEEETVIDENPSYNCEKRHGRFTHNEYCNWYYHCKDGSPSVKSCRRGKYYDSYRRNCYDEVDCGFRKPKDDYEITTSKPRDFTCPASSGKFAHPRDCDAFYACSKSKPKLYRCSKGKLFSDILRSCFDENFVTCGGRHHPDTDPEDFDNRIVDPNPKFECQTNHGQFDHEEYCDWYYNCHDKKATTRECKRGKYYDSHRRKCYNSKEVTCGHRRRPEDREISTTTEKDVTTKEPEFSCPEAHGKFPHRRDCSKFFDCKKWNHKEHKCPKHKLFDSRRKSCEDDDHVICDDRIHPDMDPDEPEDKVVDPNPRYSCRNNYGRFTHDEYCHWYYNCHNKKASVRECRRGKYYDSKRRKCYDARDVSCDGRKKPQDEEDSRTTAEDLTTVAPVFECPKPEGKYPHERDCGKFYECKKWKLKVHDCPKDKLFSEKAKKCEPEDKVTCGSRIHPDGNCASFFS